MCSSEYIFQLELLLQTLDKLTNEYYTICIPASHFFCDAGKNTAIFIFVYLLLERQVVFLLEALALADQVALLSEDGGSRGQFVRGAALAAAAPHRPHLLLVAANAV